MQFLHFVSYFLNSEKIWILLSGKVVNLHVTGYMQKREDRTNFRLVFLSKLSWFNLFNTFQTIFCPKYRPFIHFVCKISWIQLLLQQSFGFNIIQIFHLQDILNIGNIWCLGQLIIQNWAQSLNLTN